MAIRKFIHFPIVNITKNVVIKVYVSKCVGPIHTFFQIYINFSLDFNALRITIICKYPFIADFNIPRFS